MLLVLLLSVFALCLYGIRFERKGFNDSYLSKDSTNSIKGIFILLILLSHSIPYIRDCGYSFNGIIDFCFDKFFRLLSQLVVVMFLFYSGYGVGESYKLKGTPYVKAMPRHRILGTLLNFDVAVIVFIVLDLLLGISLTANQCLLSLTGWSAVGNSNWYIFVILLCYLMTYFVLRLPLKKPSQKVALLFGLCATCVLLLSLFKESYWYNTLLCYPMGFMYSTYKDKIESRIKASYWICAVMATLSFVLLYTFLRNHQISYNAVSMAFAIMVVILTLKVRINNRLLVWAGVHLFPIYIYMRLPMLFMEHQAPQFVGTYPVLFIIISLAITLMIARCYKYWEIKL